MSLACVVPATAQDEPRDGAIDGAPEIRAQLTPREFDRRQSCRSVPSHQRKRLEPRPKAVNVNRHQLRIPIETDQALNEPLRGRAGGHGETVYLRASAGTARNPTN